MITKKIKVEKQIIKEYPYTDALGNQKIRYSLGLYDGWVWRWKNDCWNKPADLLNKEVWISFEENKQLFNFANHLEKKDFIYQSKKDRQKSVDHNNYVNQKY